MTVEEIIQNLKKNIPLEFTLADGDRIQFELTLTDEYVVNFYNLQKIVRSEVFPDLAGFTMFLRELTGKHNFNQNQ